MPKGLKVEIVLWHLKDRKNFSSKHARLWIRGEIRKVGEKPKRKEFFQDAGQLLTILGKWNAEKYDAFRQAEK